MIWKRFLWIVLSVTRVSKKGVCVKKGAVGWLCLSPLALFEAGVTAAAGGPAAAEEGASFP